MLVLGAKIENGKAIVMGIDEFIFRYLGSRRYT